MPEELRAHIRYPESLLSIQTQVFALYHMTNREVYFNRSDAWKIANEILVQGGPKQPIEPYYVTTRLPGSDRPEFVLFVPMTPAGGARDNMVAWIAGRADAPDYGRLRVLTFPRDRTILGPAQVEALVAADHDTATDHDTPADDNSAADDHPATDDDGITRGRRPRQVGDRPLQRGTGSA